MEALSERYFLLIVSYFFQNCKGFLKKTEILYFFMVSPSDSGYSLYNMHCCVCKMPVCSHCMKTHRCIVKDLGSMSRFLRKT